MRRFPLVTLFAPFVLAACEGSGAAPRATVRDSAGVAIVENSALPAVDSLAWRLDSPPALTIGVIDGEPAYQFQYIRGVTRLSDGRIAVADAGSSQIRTFDTRGGHLTSIGREGDGPGEFRLLSGLFRRPGDSLLVVSGNTGAAYSLIPPAADFVHLLAFVTAFGWPHAVLSDGRMLHVRYAGSVAPGAVGFVQDSVILVVQDLAAAIARRAIGGATNVSGSTPVTLGPTDIPADTVVRLAGNDEFRQAFANGIANSPVAFGRRVEVAVHGDRIIIGTGTDGLVQVHAPNGRLVRSIRFTAARERLEQAEIDAWKRWRLDMVRNPGQQRLADEHVAAMRFPSQRPLSGAIVVDADGWIWLERYRADSGYAVSMDDAPRRWYVLDPDGRAVAAVEVPPAFRIHEIGRDYVLGVARDDMGVETVRLYSLRRGRGS